MTGEDVLTFSPRRELGIQMRYVPIPSHFKALTMAQEDEEEDEDDEEDDEEDEDEGQFNVLC